ncbi:hypothetical protein [Methanobrevibacter sp.]
MSYGWRKISIVIFIALIALCIFIAVFNSASGSYTADSVTKDYNLPIGQSMFENQSIVGTTDPVEVPLVNNFAFLSHQLQAFDLHGILMALSTGVVPFDFGTVAGEGIDSYGNVVNVKGPGFLTYAGDKLIVKQPDNYVWAYSAPSKWLQKTASGVDLYEDGKKTKSIPASEIKNLDYKNEYYNASTIADWYNYDAQDGSQFTLEKGMVGFSDGRNNISSSDVPKIFGQDVVDYANEYPTGSPILLYTGNYTEQVGEAYGTDLGSHPEYGDEIREVNARQFVDAWNGTVIPPQTSASGKDYVYFESASDSQAPGGSAAHGVCPSARALRAAVTSEGFDLPVGMCWDEDAVLFGYNPAQDITVYNNYSYPVKINMWTEGEGTGMGIYSQIVRYVPD